METVSKAFALLKLGPAYLAHLIESKSQVSFVLVLRFDPFAKTKRLDKQVPFHATTVTIYSYANDPVEAPLDPARSGALKLYAQTLGPKHAPDGVLEITTNVIDKDHYHHKYVPHWKPPRDHPSLDNPSVCAALLDLVTMCMQSLNSEHPLSVWTHVFYRCVHRPLRVIWK